MKNTVYTVITAVLLMATLCLPAAAQTWTLDNWYAGPDDDRNNGSPIHDIEFRDDHQVFFGKYDRLYKWDLNAGRLWWFDFGGDTVSHVEVPRSDSSVVIHSIDSRGETVIRDADDLSEITSIGKLGGWPFGKTHSLDVDRGGYFLVTHKQVWTRGGLGVGGPTGVTQYYTTVYRIWDGGWTFSREAFETWNSPEGDQLIHPTYGSEYSTPRFYRQSTPDSSFFTERTGKWNWENVTDSYEASADHFDRLAITSRYGSDNSTTRLAALASDNDIHVWSYGGDLLYTLNQAEDYSAHDNILEFTNNGELIVTAYGRWVRFWDVGARAEDHSFWVDAMDDDESIESLAFSDNGKLMALGSSDGTAYIYEWTGGSAPTAPPKEVEPAQPTALLSNYPNPFNPETWIPYQLSEAAEVTVTIHASDGKLVRTLELGQVPAGVYSEKDRAAYWDGQNEQGEPVASGVYFYTLTAGEFKATQKMVIRK